MMERMTELEYVFQFIDKEKQRDFISGIDFRVKDVSINPGLTDGYPLIKNKYNKLITLSRIVDDELFSFAVNKFTSNENIDYFELQDKSNESDTFLILLTYATRNFSLEKFKILVNGFDDKDLINRRKISFKNFFNNFLKQHYFIKNLSFLSSEKSDTKEIAEKMDFFVDKLAKNKEKAFRKTTKGLVSKDANIHESEISETFKKFAYKQLTLFSIKDEGDDEFDYFCKKLTLLNKGDLLDDGFINDLEKEIRGIINRQSRKTNEVNPPILMLEKRFEALMEVNNELPYRLLKQSLLSNVNNEALIELDNPFFYILRKINSLSEFNKEKTPIIHDLMNRFLNDIRDECIKENKTIDLSNRSVIQFFPLSNVIEILKYLDVLNKKDAHLKQDNPLQDLILNHLNLKDNFNKTAILAFILKDILLKDNFNDYKGSLYSNYLKQEFNNLRDEDKILIMDNLSGALSVELSEYQAKSSKIYKKIVNCLCEFNAIDAFLKLCDSKEYLLENRYFSDLKKEVFWQESNIQPASLSAAIQPKKHKI